MSNIKRVFTSRYPGGKIVEVDWSQLEIYMLQLVSGDAELAAELNAHIDLHTMMTAQIFRAKYLDVTLAIKEHDAVWTERRRQTKRARFALQYGASHLRISQLTGWSIDESKRFIKAYYDKYKGIAYYHDEVKQRVLESAKIVGVDGSVTKYKGQFINPNGRRFVFDGIDENNGRGVRFSGTQLKNYPIQGLASDFVKLMAVQLDSGLQQVAPRTLMVNTIHDSVVLDVPEEELRDVYNAIEFVYGLKAREVFSSMCYTRPVDVNVTFTYSINTDTYWSK